LNLVLRIKWEPAACETKVKVGYGKAAQLSRSPHFISIYCCQSSVFEFRYAWIWTELCRSHDNELAHNWNLKRWLLLMCFIFETGSCGLGFNRVQSWMLPNFQRFWQIRSFWKIRNCETF